MIGYVEWCSPLDFNTANLCVILIKSTFVIVSRFDPMQSLSQGQQILVEPLNKDSGRVKFWGHLHSENNLGPMWWLCLPPNYALTITMLRLLCKRRISALAL